MRIIQLSGTIKTVAFHAGFSHYLFDHKDCEKTEQDIRPFDGLLSSKDSDIKLPGNGTA